MRIAVETLDPLPFFKCWYLFEENDGSTVGDLRKSLNREFQLAKKSSHLKLMAGGFEYLPRFQLKNYILENDLVMIAAQGSDQERKVSEAVKVKEKIQEEKRRAKDEKKRAKEEKKLAKEQKRIEKKRKRASEDEVESVKRPRAAEGQGKLTRSQKRNARKKAKRLRQREEALQEELEELAEDEAPTPEPVRKQQQEGQIAAPERLLKQNKNKKANFLKEIGKKTRSHVYFDAEQQEQHEQEQEQDYYGEEEEYTQEQDNAYGSAIVTSVEADDSYTGEKRGIEYPIHTVGEYFYADPPPAADYDSLPEVSFSGPCPVENDHLAIKMLEMTASYTPEISDWKEVKVLSFDQALGVLTVEFLPGFLLTEHRGKFTLRDKNQTEDQEDEEPIETVLEDQTRQLSQFDVADMRRL